MQTATTLPELSDQLPSIHEFRDEATPEKVGDLLTHLTNARQSIGLGAPLHLTISGSRGGNLGAVRHFLEQVEVRKLRPLHTSGVGEIAGNSILLFLAGDQRVLPPNSALRFVVGTVIPQAIRQTADELVALAAEVHLTDGLFAQLVAEHCRNTSLTKAGVLQLMRESNIIQARRALMLGLADSTGNNGH